MALSTLPHHYLLLLLLLHSVYLNESEFLFFFFFFLTLLTFPSLARVYNLNLVAEPFVYIVVMINAGCNFSTFTNSKTSW